MALLELVLQSTFFGQEVINRFNYLSQGTPASVSLSFALTSAFGCIYDNLAVPVGYPPDTVFDRIRTAQATAVTYDFVSVKDVYSPTDFYETPFLEPAAGKFAGDAMPPTVAYGFRTNRVRADIRRGMKRFVGASEGNINSGGVISPTWMNGALTDLAQMLGEVLIYNDEGNTISFSPCIVSKEKYIPDPLRPERVAYKYYDTFAEQEQHLAVGVLYDPYPQTRTQNSRQYGRGR